MEIKIFNKTLIPTQEELEELKGIVDFLDSDDEESVKLGETLYNSSLYLKRVRRYKCIVKYYFDFAISNPSLIYKTIRNIKDINFFIKLILNGLGYNYSFSSDIEIKRIKFITICNA